MLQRLLLSTLILAGVGSALSQTALADCNQCSSQSSCKNCRPNSTRIYIWRSNIVGGGLSPVMGGAPPQGFAVSSIPAVMVTQPAIAISPASFSPGFSGASLSSNDIDRIADAVARRPGATAGAGIAGAAAGAAGSTCTDPCGSILQLQRDVKDLTSAIDKITTKLEAIDAQLKAKN